MGQIITFSSGSGGVGKSTLCLNLGLELSKESKVLLIDSCFQFRNLDLMLNLEDKVVYDFYDFVNREVEKDRVLLKSEKGEMYLLSPSQSKVFSDLDMEKLRQRTKLLMDDFDYILVDLPLDYEVIKYWSIYSTKNIIITSEENISLRNVDKLVWEMDKAKYKGSYIILFNNVKSVNGNSFDYSFLSNRKVESIYRIPNLQSFVEDDKYFVENSERDYFMDISQIIKGNKVEQRPWSQAEVKKNFWNRLFGK